MKQLIPIVVLLFIMQSIVAQEAPKNNKKTWGIAVLMGSNTFYGDIKQYQKNANKKQNAINFNSGLQINKEFFSFLELHSFINKGSITGSSSVYHLFFKTNYIEYGLGVSVNITRLIKAPQDKVNVIFTGGAGILGFRSIAKDLVSETFTTGYGYLNDGSKTKVTNEVAAPIGIIIRYNINQLANVALHYELHSIKSDKLDGFTLQDSHNDRFSSINLALSYKIK